MTDQAHRFADLMVAATGRGPMTSAEVEAEMSQPICRWCRDPVIRAVPCSCDRAQTELARIRAGSDR